MTAAVVSLATTPGLTAGACAALNVSRASVYRRRAGLARPLAALRPRPSPRRALAVVERRAILDLLRAPRFADQAPAEVYAILLDEGVYHCSIRTMYRILAANQEVRERRDHLRHPVYKKPELLAQAPNEVWSWDITKLMGPAKWTYFYLYVIIDIFSRRIVGWCVADRESATLFTALFNDAIAKHSVPPGQLTLHADRGGRARRASHLPGGRRVLELIWVTERARRRLSVRLIGNFSLFHRPSCKTVGNSRRIRHLPRLLREPIPTEGAWERAPPVMKGKYTAGREPG